MGRLLAHRGSAGCGVRCCHNGRCCRGAQKANVNVETRLLLSVELRGPRLAVVEQPAGAALRRNELVSDAPSVLVVRARVLAVVVGGLARRGVRVRGRGRGRVRVRVRVGSG